jgi:hypothetical protein
LVLIEHLLEQAAILNWYRSLRPRPQLGPSAHRACGRAQLGEAMNLGLGQDLVVGPAEAPAPLGHRPNDCLPVAARRQPVVHHGADVPLGVADYALDLAVGDDVRCFSGVALLMIDEAARVSDALYVSVRAMLAVCQGRLLALSTPFGRRGWFSDEWVKDDASWSAGEFSRQADVWHRYRPPATDCPRIGREFLAEERQALGERWYAQEHKCEFMDVVGAVVSGAEIDAVFQMPLGGGIPFPND